MSKVTTAATTVQEQKQGLALFNEDDDNDNDGASNGVEKKSNSLFRVNSRYATAFESRKQKAELKRHQHTRNYDNDNDDDSCTSTSSSEEDEDANLLTNSLNTKIFETMNALRRKDARIYDSSIQFFTNAQISTSANNDDDDDDFFSSSASCNDSSQTKTVQGCFASRNLATNPTRRR
jgi:hypothetical protein